MKIYKLNNAHHLPVDWDKMAETIYQKRNFLDYLEKTNFSDQRYYVLSENNIPLAGAVVYSLKINLFTFSKLQLKIPMQIIGIPLSNDESGLLGDSQNVTKLVSEILKIEKGTILCLNHNQHIDKHDVIKMQSLPSMVMKLKHDCWEKYLQSLRHPYRRRILKSLQKSENLILQSSDCTNFSEVHYKQYLEVVNRSTTVLEILDMSFFKNLPNSFRLNSFFENEKLLFWNITIDNNKILYFLFGGLDFDTKAIYDSYNNNLISVIKEGHSRNCLYINLGQTAETPKSRFGANQVEKKMFLYHRNLLVRLLFKSIKRQLTYSSNPIKNNVYKNDSFYHEESFLNSQSVLNKQKKKYSKPYLNKLLNILKMDKDYYKAKGNYIYSFDGKTHSKYLDLVGGYGSLMLGHNNPNIISSIMENIENNNISHNQLSRKPKLNLLAQRINDLIGSKTKLNYITVVLNTGSEAVEAALKHAFLSFENKLLSVENEINKSLVLINESFFFQYPRQSLTYNNYKFNSIEEVSEYVNSLNSNVFDSYNPKIIATNKSFHGKTLGALSITSNQSFRRSFTKNSPFESIFLDIYSKFPEDLFSQYKFDIYIPRISKNGVLSFKKKKMNWIVSAIVEPVIGEGGVHVVPEEFLKDLRYFTFKNDIPLIFDEIQSGCYRTGLFLASFNFGVNADYYILGKSLGGGMSKISALVIEEKQYIPEFDVIHSSTFAEDDFSTTLALKSLDILSRDGQQTHYKSNYLWRLLNSLKEEYTDIIGEIRGLGLMIGIEFKSMSLSSSSGIQGLSRSKYFGYILAAYLLNKKNIRVSVTLSDSRTLRLLPSIYITDELIVQVVKALGDLCQILRYGDFYSLVDFLLPDQFQNLRPVTNFYPKNIPLDDVNNCIDNVGFLLHYIDINTIRAYLPSLKVLPDKVILDLVEQLSPFSEPVIIGRNRISDINNNKIGITFVGLSFTAKMVSDTLRKSIGGISSYQELCNKAITTLFDLGISKIGLGQYNSIIMQNGKAVSNPKIRVTTGNGFTAYSVYQKIREAIRIRENVSTKLGIIGAGGNIAKVLSSMLIHQVDTLLLLGRSEAKQEKLEIHAGQLIYEMHQTMKAGYENENMIHQQIKQLFAYNSTHLYNSGHDFKTYWKLYSDKFSNEKRIEIGSDLALLSDCDIVIVATSDPNPFLNVKYFKKNAYICDISVPLNCDNELLTHPDFQVIQGGLISLPQQENLHPPGLYLNKGQAYACMVETMLMGFEQSKGSYSYGAISKEQVQDLGDRLLSHGFDCKISLRELSH